MREFQGRRWLKRAIYSKYFLLLVLLVAALFAKVVFGIWWRSRGVDESRETAETQLRELQLRRQTLIQDLARLETEAGVEAELRAKFSVAKPGEKVINVIYEEATTTELAESGWLERLLKLFAKDKRD